MASFYKLNFDGSVIRTRKAVVGFVIRDQTGAMVIDSSMPVGFASACN